MTAPSRRALLADGGPPASLAVARSLVRAGWSVEVTRSGPGDRAAAARGTIPFRAPTPTADPDGFIGAIIERAAAGAPGIVIPCSDAALLAVLARRAGVEAVARVPLPATTVVRSVLEKERTLAAARAAGVRVPATCVLRTAEDLPGCEVVPPLAVKPLSSRWVAPDGGVRGAGVAFAADASRLAEVAGALLADACPGVLVQGWEPGTGIGVGVVMRAGAPRAAFVHRRLREVHPAGGPSAAAVAVVADPAVVDPAVALLRELGWEGLAMVEFRRDGSAEPVLMEVNGRPWGTLGLAVDAGADLPRWWLEDAPDPCPPYRVGTRRRWLAGDLRRVLAAWRGAPPDYPGRFPSTMSALGAALFRPAPDLVFRWSDPGPFLAEVRGVFA